MRMVCRRKRALQQTKIHTRAAKFILSPASQSPGMAREWRGLASTAPQLNKPHPTLGLLFRFTFEEIGTELAIRPSVKTLKMNSRTGNGLGSHALPSAVRHHPRKSRTKCLRLAVASLKINLRIS